MKRLLLSLCLILLDACSPPLTQNPPTLAPAYEGCAYTWATKGLPELTAQLDSDIKTLDLEATAHVTAYGEDCVYADGHADFSAMETDFHVQFPASDLADFESFGNRIEQSMKVIDKLPQERIAGPNPGFVEFKFQKSEGDFLIVRVPIQQYRNEAGGKTGEELFRLFYTEP